MKYSQREEETYILRALEGMQPARFLDIGAYDGVQFSNTMALVERGWFGVMVEPGLEAFQSLLRNHGGNERVTLIHAAVGTTPGLAKFFNNPSTYSTTEEANRKKFGHTEKFSRYFFVPPITFDDLVPWLHGMEMLSIDTEGTSVDLLLAFPTHTYRPKVVCVEHDTRLQECKDWSVRNGYSALMANVENLIFVRNDK